MGIILDKKLGVNPVLTYCPRCGEATNELLLVGTAAKYECTNCQRKFIGRPRVCDNCGSSTFTNLGKIDGTHERLPATDICDNCKKEIKEFNEEIEKGGVAWKCEDCGNTGVIKHTAAFAKDFVKEHGKHAGVLFNKEMCPVCNS